MSQYYSDYIVQKKGQEVVAAGVKECIKKAIDAFDDKWGEMKRQTAPAQKAEAKPPTTKPPKDKNAALPKIPLCKKKI